MSSDDEELDAEVRKFNADQGKHFYPSYLIALSSLVPIGSIFYGS